MMKIENKQKLPRATRFAALACTEEDHNEEDHIEFPDITTAAKATTTSAKMPKWIDKMTQKDKKKKVIDESGEVPGEVIAEANDIHIGIILNASRDATSGSFSGRRKAARHQGGGDQLRGAQSHMPAVPKSRRYEATEPAAGRKSPDDRKLKICSKSYMAACECSDKEFGGHLQAVSFVEQADVVRSQCMAERESCNCAEVAPKCIWADDRPINEIQGGGKTFDGGWQMITMAVDSGAAETVIPHTLVMGQPIMETAASKAGVNYASATGQPIPNLGEQRLPLCTSEGSLRSMTFQAAPVSRALGSVKRMNETGHIVVFDGTDSYIQNKATGEITWLREENGNYLMDLWIMPMDDLTEMKRQGFGRQH